MKRTPQGPQGAAKVPRGVDIPTERQHGIVDFLMAWIGRENARTSRESVSFVTQGEVSNNKMRPNYVLKMNMMFTFAHEKWYNIRHINKV